VEFKPLIKTALILFRDVMEPDGCGFHVQNPSDSDADTDTDLSRDQNYQLL